MNTHRPLVSVVIPAFNAAAHLEKTLHSVLRQTYRSLEVIVVDDGSTDATPALVQAAQAADPRIRFLRQRNAGVGAARNVGIRFARGKYIAPLDADDLWAPHKLEQQVIRIERAGPKTGMVYCWSRNIDGADRVISWSHPYRFEGRFGALMMLGNLVGNASVPLFRASALAVVGGYLSREEQDGAQGCEDWDLNIRIAEKFGICCVPQYLVSYRQVDASMSLDERAMALSFEVGIRRAYERTPDLPPMLRTWASGGFYAYLLNKCYRWSNYSGALWCLGKLVQNDAAAWLNGRNYRIMAFSLFHLITAGQFRRHRKPPSLSLTDDPRFEQSPPPATQPNGLFAYIQGRRMHFALRQRWREKPDVRIKRAFGY